MSNLVDNFLNYTQFHPTTNNMYAMTSSGLTSRCGYPSGTISPDLEQFENSYSPLNINQYPSNFEDSSRMNSGSPLIQLKPCQNGENSACMAQPTPLKSGSAAFRPNHRSKLSNKSKAFVVQKGSKRLSSARRVSQDTKAHSDEDGNSTDGSEGSTPKSYSSSHVSNGHQEFTQNGKFVNSDETKQSQNKFKTELCKNWQTGTCKFGSKCAFAHGVEELTEKKNLPSNYKTKICKQFHEEMYCSYGSRCQFIHLQNATSVKDSVLSSAINSLAGVRLSKKDNKSRLSVFKGLTN